MLLPETKQDALRLANSARGELGRRHARHFFKLIYPNHTINWHHGLLLDKLQKFAKGEIKNRIFSMPPQHGKSELCSRMLPAYLLGLHPTRRIISASYNADNSAKFNRDVQRLIDSDNYRLAFPKTKLFAKSVKSSSAGTWLRNRDEFETVEYGGYYKNAGIGGGITGRSADFAIIDDPVKGAADAASAAVRNAIWNWYVQDLGTRLNNNSQQLIIMTRWHDDDLVGRILSNPETAKDWDVVVLPAIKENNHNPDDPRQIGEALWESFQGIARLGTARALGERAFQCLYQQNPSANKDLLIFPDYEVCEDRDYDNVDASEVFGLDFGFNDELALVGTKLKGNALYLRELLYKRGMTTPMIIEALRSLGVGRKIIVCDNARPEQIKELKDAGFAAVPCVKGANSVSDGIAQMQGRKLVVSRSSPNIISELNGYEWVTDALGKATETPAEGRKHHAIDGIRYALRYTMSMRNLGRVRVSEGYIEG
jgi:hypothetical protein